jgi:hypothetical protein
MACSLLIKTFLSGNMFIVGDSITTGARNQVVWGGVHLKTSPSGGTAFHGWPDRTYFDRLVNECGSVGVFTNEHEKLMAQAAKKRTGCQRVFSSSKTDTAQTRASPNVDATTATTSVEDTSLAESKLLEKLRAEVEQLSRDIQDAMRKQNLGKIRELMVERSKVQAVLRTTAAA